ncbi:hypothetical protein ACU4GD_41455 [Cupriavidus basilensis]
MGSTASAPGPLILVRPGVGHALIEHREGARAAVLALGGTDGRVLPPQPALAPAFSSWRPIASSPGTAGPGAAH